MVILLFCSFFVSLLFAVFCIRLARGHAKRYDEAKPQRFHAGDVPRVGGVGVLAGAVAGWLVAAIAGAFGIRLNIDVDWAFAWPWAVLVLPAVLGGCMKT